MEKVYTIEVTSSRADYCIGAFANYDKAKEYFEKMKPVVGTTQTPMIEVENGNGLLLVEWQGDEFEVIETWAKGWG